MSTYKRHILELHLQKVVLELPAYAAQSGERGVLVSLIAPRPMIAERTTPKTVHFDQGAFSAKAEPFHQTILFKETVQGPFGLQFAVTEQADFSALDDWILDLSDYALRGAGSWFVAGFPSFLRVFAQRPFRRAGEEVNPRSRPVAYVGTGGITVHDSTPVQRHVLTIDLISPEEVHLPRPLVRPIKQSRGGARRAPVKGSERVAAGAKIGYAEVSLRIV